MIKFIFGFVVSLAMTIVFIIRDIDQGKITEHYDEAEGGKYFIVRQSPPRDPLSF